MLACSIKSFAIDFLVVFISLPSCWHFGWTGASFLPAISRVDVTKIGLVSLDTPGYVLVKFILIDISGPSDQY